MIASIYPGVAQAQEPNDWFESKVRPILVEWVQKVPQIPEKPHSSSGPPNLDVLHSTTPTMRKVASITPGPLAPG